MTIFAIIGLIVVAIIGILLILKSVIETGFWLSMGGDIEWWEWLIIAVIFSLGCFCLYEVWIHLNIHIQIV